MHKTCLLLPVLLLFLNPGLHGQWLTQEIPLEPGWNAVHLEVRPEPAQCQDAFAGLPVQAVWKWNRRFSTIQFAVDPNTLLPEDPDWLVWLPPSDPRAFLGRLGTLQGGQSYLIRVAPNTPRFTLRLKGRAMLPRPEWYPHGLNLIGFPVHPDRPPTFAEFFRFTSEVDTTQGYANELYQLDASGAGQRVVQPSRQRMRPGTAYWVGCARAPAHLSALHVSPGGGSAIEFGTLLNRQELLVKNAHPDTPLTVHLRQHASETPPTTGAYPELAGPVPLAWLTRNASNVWVWEAFPESGLSRTLTPGEEWKLWLAVRRRDFAPYTPQGTNGALYQSILEATDSAGSLRIRLPVTAQSPAHRRGPTVLANAEAPDASAGLWVGSVVLDRVNAPAYSGTNLLATPAPASFRLLLHVDAYGQARLLQRVVLAWDPTRVDPPHTNGTYALYADEQALPAVATNVMRIDSVAFPIMPPLTLTGSLTNALTGALATRFDDPTNPFLHRYHPMHDNQDWDFEPYPEAVESRSIHRTVALTFNTVTNASTHPFHGVDRVSGNYHETLSGLRAQDILVRGTFALQRISRIDQLQATP